MGIKSLGAALKDAVDKRIENEARAQRGTISNGRLQVGAKSYPFTTAVDVGAYNGSKVWAQLSKNGKAVIIGD